ncbi:MAG: LON peptidase substrate-binding domain-containing protein, partial [Pyrinomonadaceae bacterium]|nr:LON peptidase substrate-binding domain-containing protein [Pyrinomonadaceae bacterium]
MAEQTNKNLNEQTVAPEQLEIAVLPLQNTTLFPETVVPLSVGRDRSVKAVEFALSTEQKLIC